LFLSKAAPSAFVAVCVRELASLHPIETGMPTHGGSVALSMFGQFRVYKCESRKSTVQVSFLSFKTQKPNINVRLFRSFCWKQKSCQFRTEHQCSFSEANALRTKSSFCTHYPTAALREWVLNCPFSDYRVDSNNFKNIFSGCDWFKSFIPMLPKCTPKFILEEAHKVLRWTTGFPVASGRLPGCF